MSCLFPVAQLHFYPRPPRGGRPPVSFFSAIFAYFYPRPPRGGRQSRRAGRVGEQQISIHALREEGDNNFFHDLLLYFYFYPRPPRGGRRAEVQLSLADRDISIHALREEGDEMARAKAGLSQEFLSTPSARRATAQNADNGHQQSDFYPRPPRGGRPKYNKEWYFSISISIHALREEGDDTAHRPRSAPADFYPRPPRGGRHLRGSWGVCKCGNFYPRPPRGGRLAYQSRENP